KERLDVAFHPEAVLKGAGRMKCNPATAAWGRRRQERPELLPLGRDHFADIMDELRDAPSLSGVGCVLRELVAVVLDHHAAPAGARPTCSSTICRPMSRSRL